jgi:membrane associated rhomboid family serine protease
MWRRADRFITDRPALAFALASVLMTAVFLAAGDQAALAVVGGVLFALIAVGGGEWRRRRRRLNS